MRSPWFRLVTAGSPSGAIPPTKEPGSFNCMFAAADTMKLLSEYDSVSRNEKRK